MVILDWPPTQGNKNKSAELIFKFIVPIYPRYTDPRYLLEYLSKYVETVDT